MEEATQPLLSPQLLRLLLVQGVWRDGGHWSALRWVSLNGLPHGLIQQLHQLALRLLQQLCLDSLQDKAGRSARSLHPVSLPPIHQTLPEPTSVPGTPLRAQDGQKNKHGSCPEVPPYPQFNSLWFPRAAVRIRERRFQSLDLTPNHLVLSDPTLFSLTPAFPLLTSSPANRRLFTG